MNIRSLVACTLCLLSFSSVAHAGTYDYYGKASLKLGSGFRKLNPSQPPAPCLVVSKQTVEEDSTVGKFKLETEKVTDRQTLHTLLHVDAHLAARTLVLSQFNLEG
jgi:hypothetical protein